MGTEVLVRCKACGETRPTFAMKMLVRPYPPGGLLGGTASVPGGMERGYFCTTSVECRKTGLRWEMETR